MKHKVTTTKEYNIPETNYCYHYKKNKNQCNGCIDKSEHISSSEARSCGLGYSSGTINMYVCEVFNKTLSPTQLCGLIIPKLKECKSLPSAEGKEDKQ